MYYFCRLVPPRPDFAKTLSADEAAMMKQHAAYWHDMMSRGLVEVFGLVGDPQGFFGIGVLSLADGVDPLTLTSADPAILANRGLRYDVHPMVSAVVRHPPA